MTWYTWLEQGRQINASTQVLGAVARTLRLDPAEREHLFRLADVPDAAGAAGADGGGCEQVTADVQHILDALVPLPASVLNERFDLLAWNAAYEVLWPSRRRPRALRAEHPLAELHCTRSAAIPTSTGTSSCPPWWPSCAGRTAVTWASPPGPGSCGGCRRAARTSPGCGPSRTWRATATYLKIFRHPAHERLAMTTTSLAVLAVPGTRVVVYTPADEVTRHAVAGLLRGEGADARFSCWGSHQRQRAELGQALS